ncbi:hypothetical protein HOP50_03g20090 [Chloropicon primus]|uniref:F-box domain-containing protein n=2 Tax=Chloropicon primus TaxID=1764295 RepID=A0A5B8MGE0_9CHLO|nr:hypothetical protein A3770_03p20110 [Chloropicon primus]UPQ98703.1 hypothetical protein HOP50_03g20090 [Chloropicon primus]|eukprot:QDZ19493.1 hypothetical protein A3770_03p20110 [Chloropicon primus]
MKGKGVGSQGTGTGTGTGTSKILHQYARKIGKAFVRPGAIARYVDAQKVSKSNLAILQGVGNGVHGRPRPAKGGGERQRASLRSSGGTSSKGKGKQPQWEASSPAPVDITLKGKSGKRVRSYLSDEQLKFQYATVPTPRGIASGGAQAQRQRGERGSKKSRGERQVSVHDVSHKAQKKGVLRTPLSPKLLSLPSDILTRVFCSMKHQDMAPIMSVCTRLADAAKTAITTHFNFLTPDPKRAPYYSRDGTTSDVGGATTSSRGAAGAGGGRRDPNPQAVFGSASQPIPMAPKQKRRSKRITPRRRRGGPKIKKRSLVFEDNPTTSGSSSLSESGSGSGPSSGSK